MKSLCFSGEMDELCKMEAPMTDLEKALGWEKELLLKQSQNSRTAPRLFIIDQFEEMFLTLAAAYRAKCSEFKIVCAEHRAEKERADKAEEALKQMVRNLNDGFTSGAKVITANQQYPAHMTQCRNHPAYTDLTHAPSPRLKGEWPS